MRYVIENAATEAGNKYALDSLQLRKTIDAMAQALRLDELPEEEVFSKVQCRWIINKLMERFASTLVDTSDRSGWPQASAC